VLAHRLGLIPIQADARLLEENEGGNPTDRNTLVFRLAVECKKSDEEQTANDVDNYANEQTVADHVDEELLQAARDAGSNATSENPQSKVYYPQGRPFTKHVYSRDLQWVPQGDQELSLNVKAIHDDILIAKLRPGQSIELEAHARRGIGKDHAKFSPVATASYRLFPNIELLEPVYDDLARELCHVYEPGVFELVPTTKNDRKGTQVKARVCNPYACTMSRNYIRNPLLEKAIRMTRSPDHFIFSVESVGHHSPGVLVAEALKVLQSKCQRVIDLAEQSQVQTEY
jgi:DNA-directed RNA polymerase I and III subunit RPAC1